MRTRPLAARLLMALALPGASPGPAQEQPPRFRARTELVVVDVVVADAQGKPVEGLRREDFRLSEDGKDQDIATFEAVALAAAAPAGTPSTESSATQTAPDASTMAIVFDDLHLRPLDADRLKTAVRDLLRSESASRTQVALIAPGAAVASGGRLPEAQADFENVLARLQGLEVAAATMSEQEAYEINSLRNESLEVVVAERLLLKGQGGGNTATTRPEVRARAAELDRECSTRRQATLEAVTKSLGWLAGVKGRRSLVLASRGFVADAGLDGFRRTIEASRRANVPVHLLDARGLEGLDPDRDLQGVSTSQEGRQAHSAQAAAGRFAEAEGAEHVALDTGGLVLRKRNDLAAGLRLIADTSRSYYLLGYYPKNERRDGNWRKLKVEVAKGPQKREVRARRGYFAPLD